MSQFEELDVDPIEGAEIIDMMGIDQDEMEDTGRFQKIQEIIQFFQGKEDKRHVLTSLLAGKGDIDATNHVWSYVSLRKQREEKKVELEKLEKDLRYYE